MVDHQFVARADPRFAASCVRCWSPKLAHPVTHVDRDVQGERVLSALAAQAASVPEHAARSLDDFADKRALPGGVRVGLDAFREMREELADARNYALWGIQQILPGVEVGEHDALEAYSRLMRALASVQRGWLELHS